MSWAVGTVLSRVSGWVSPGVRFEPKDDARRCGGCGYPFPGGVRGSPAPCSECGRFIDPAASGAFASEQPSWIVRHFMRAPGLVIVTASIATAALLLHGISVPGERLDSLLTGLGAAFVLVPLVMVRILSAFVLGLWKGRSRAVWAQRGWWVLAAIVVAAITLAVLGTPRRIAFAADRSTLEVLARQWEQDPLGVVGFDDGSMRVASEEGRPMEAADLQQFKSQILAADRPAWRGFIVGIRHSGFADEQGAYFYLPDVEPDLAERFGLMPHGGGWYSGSIWW